MNEIYYKNKYRIASARRDGYDYSKNGFYFITICTIDRIFFFGDIVDAEMKLSPIGDCAQNCWVEIPSHFPFVKLYEFVVMPNHIHGILQIAKTPPVETQDFASPPESQIQNIRMHNTGMQNKEMQNKEMQNKETQNKETQNKEMQNKEMQNKETQNKETQNLASLRQGEYKNQFGPQAKNLASIIRGFKIGVTNYANKNRIEFKWQTRFHDRIIRNDDELNNARQYILDNPQKWELNKNNTEDLYI